MLKYRIIPCE